MKKIFAILALAGTILPASAQNDSILSLRQCIDLAEQHNAAIKQADYSLQAAEEQAKEVFTKYFPQVGLLGSGFVANKRAVQFSIIDMLQVQLIKHGVVGGAQAIQPLFMGGQIVNGNSLAKVGRAVAELQRQQSQQQVSLTTETYYRKLATLHSTRETLSQALQMLDTLQNQVQVGVNAGLAIQNDLLKVDLKRNEYRANMVDLENGISLMRMLLSQYIGANFERPIDIQWEIPAEVPEYPLSIHVDPAQALAETINYQLLNQQVRAKQLEKRMELGKHLPTVAAGAGWYYYNLLDEGKNYGSLQVMVSIPLSDWWGGSHAIKRKNAELEKAKLERDDLSQMIQIDMQNKWDELTAAHRKMEIAHEAIGQANENMRLNRLYYSSGTSTITNLLEAQTLLYQAHTRYAESFGAFCTARTAYLHATAQ